MNYFEKRRAAQLRNFEKLPNGCWRWLGALDKDGYGKVKRHGRDRRAHQVFFEEYVGLIPYGKIVCHTCDNTWCVNPNHLFAGTHLENEQDKDRKGRRVMPTEEQMIVGRRRGGEALRDASTPEERSARASKSSQFLSREQRRQNGLTTMSRLTPEQRRRHAKSAGKLGGIASGVSRRRKHAAGFDAPIGWEGDA